MYIIIAGGGKVGSFLARGLAGKRHDVVVLEKDEDLAKKMAEDLPRSLVISGDGCDPHRLEEAGIDRAKVVAAVTGDDEDNLIICQLAKETYGVRRVIARINNPKNEKTFHALGIDGISSTTIISKLIEEEAAIGDIITLLTLKGGRLAIVELDLTPDSPVIKRPVKDLDLPRDSVLVSVVRGEKVFIPKGNTILEAKDTVLALVHPEQERALKKALLGK